MFQTLNYSIHNYFLILKIKIFEAPWRRATFIVLQNEILNAINHHMIK